MSSVSLNPLTPETDYKAPNDLDLSRQVWDLVFLSIGARLRGLEGRDADYQATVNLLKTQALAVISASVASEIEARRQDLAELQGQFEAVSDAYIELVSGGVYADGIQLRDNIPGITGHTVQAALAGLADKFATQRRITVATLFLGAS